MAEGIKTMIEVFPALCGKLGQSLILLIVPALIGLVIGTLFCIARVGKKNIIYYFVAFNVSFWRGTPQMVQLFLFFYGIPILFNALFGISTRAWSTWFLVIITLGLNMGVYYCEALRSAYLSVDKGQIEAGYSIGYSKLQCFFKVIAPQTLRIALPNMKNLTTELLKTTALAFALGIVDVMGEANQLSTIRYGVGQMWILTAAAVIYWVMNVVLCWFFQYMEMIFSNGEVGYIRHPSEKKLFRQHFTITSLRNGGVSNGI